LGLIPWLAAAAPAILAACPVFVFQAIQPMSDVVATAWCLATILCALRSRGDWRWAAAAGLCFGIAVLVRPIDALIAIPLAFAMPLDRRRIAAFAASGLPAAVVFAAYNTVCYGSALATGYGITGHWDALAWPNFPPRLRNYSLWTARVMTPLVCLGFAAALLERRIAGRTRALLGTWFGAFFLFYCFYGPADDWWYTRFLLPGLPAVPLAFVLGAAALGERIGARRPAWRPVWSAAQAAVVLIVAIAGLRAARRLGVLGMPGEQAVFPVACRLAAVAAPPGSLVVSMDLSGALRYYAPGLTPVRWDALDPSGLATLRAASGAAGVRWYALLRDYEARDALAAVPGAWRLQARVGSAGLWRLEAGEASP
jgi:4-amino-4-deoxy-L-arabinose transferase-like glycosyltransferase